MLDERDLKSIKVVVKDIVGESIKSNNEKMLEEIKDLIEFSAEKSEQRMEVMMDEKVGKIADEFLDFRNEMHREITDIAEMNREFLGKIDNHEKRIGTLELKTGLVVK